MFSHVSEDMAMSEKLNKRYSKGYKGYKKGKKVKINGEVFETHSPKNHTVIDGVIYKTWDANAWDDYANISDWQAICFIKRKKGKLWEKLYKGRLGQFAIAGEAIKGHGLHYIYFLLETPATRKRLIKEARISFLKKEKKKIEKELKELCGTR
jgi:hypothetical protein